MTPGFTAGQDRILRWLSTNHLMGHGYWVWLIPLPTGATSVGIMTDPALHSFDELNRADRLLAWLAVREPQLASTVAAHEILDFHRMKTKSYLATRAFSCDRWALSGESAYYVDALYSPGGDFIAVGEYADIQDDSSGLRGQTAHVVGLRAFRGSTASVECSATIWASFIGTIV